jgi:gliding motility-associated-like protein
LFLCFFWGGVCFKNSLYLWVLNFVGIIMCVCFRVLFFWVAAFFGVVVAGYGQCVSLFSCDTLVVGSAGSGMRLGLRDGGDVGVFSFFLRDASWVGVTASGSSLELIVEESNESVIGRVGFLCVDYGVGCRDSVVLVQPGKVCERGIDGTEGRLFFVGFSENINVSPQLSLVVTAAEGTSGRVSLPRGSYSQEFTVPGNGVSMVSLSPVSSFCVSTGEVVEDKGVLVETVGKVSLYASNSESKSSDATNILPVEALGDEYYTLSYNAHRGEEGSHLVATPEEFLIVATEDHTLVTIVPSSETGGDSGLSIQRRAGGEPFTVRLHRGQTYLVKSYLGGEGENGSYFRSITGSYIKSTGLIAVFAGHKRAKVGCADDVETNPSRDNLYQQLSPLRLWGNRYAVVSTGMREDVYRVVAAYDSTVVQVNGVVEPPLRRGEYRDFTVSQGAHRYVMSDKPVQVGLFGESQSCFGVQRGDPFLVVLNPLENEIRGVTFAALPLSDIRDQYAIVLSQSSATATVSLTDAGGVIVPLVFYNIPGSGYAYARVQIAHGSYHLYSSVGFTAYVYGFGDAESYAYSVGARFNHLTPPDVSSDTLYCVGQVAKQLWEYWTDEGALLWYDSADGEVPLGDSLPALVTDEAGDYSFWVSRMVDCSESPRRMLRVSVQPLPEIQFRDSVACHVHTSWSMAFPEGGSYTGAGCLEGAFYPAVAGLGTHTLTYMYDDEYGCVNSVTDTVRVVDFPSQPTIRASGATSFCEGESVVLSVDAPDAISYQWYRNGMAVGDSTGTCFRATASGTYTVMAKCLAYGSNAIVVEAYPLPGVPVIRAGGATEVCVGDSIVLTAEATNATRYRWFREGAATGMEGSRLVALTGGVYTVRAYNPANCPSEESAVVRLTVWPAPAAAIISLEGRAAFCTGDSAVLTAHYGSGLSGQWERDGSAVGGTVSDIYVYVVRESGMYRFRVEDVHGCRSGSNVIGVTVYPLPATPVIYSGQPLGALCYGDSAWLESDVSGMEDYQWLRNGVDIAGATATRYVATETGTYTLRAEDSNGCVSMESNALPAQVYRRPDIPTVTTVGAVAFCPGQSVVLEATSTGAQRYYWTLDGEWWMVTTEPSVRAWTGGEYRVEAYGAGDCPALGSSEAVRVTLFDAPGDPVWGNVAGGGFCEGETLRLAASGEGATSYEWYKDGRRIAGASDSVYTAPAPGRYTVRAVNGYSCYSSGMAEELDVTMYPLPLRPEIVCAGTPPFYAGRDYALALRYVEEDVRYEWYKDFVFTGVAGSSYTLAEASKSDGGTYTVEAVSGNNCRRQSATFEVTVSPSPLFIPNVFTPNGDGVNDYFRIAGLDHYDSCELQVINKRGKTVFSAVRYQNEWDGDNLPDDIYYYHLQLRHTDGAASVYDGYVHVKR